jgi:hypothetical protein
MVSTTGAGFWQTLHSSASIQIPSRRGKPEKAALLLRSMA